MINQNKQLTLKFFIGLIVIISVVCVNLYPYIVANYTDSSFPKEGENSSIIGCYIVEGAGHLLKGYSDILLFLNKIEMSDIDGTDYSELQEILGRAIENMTLSKKAYLQLITTAGASAYNPLITYRLLAFDYQGFQRENGLIADVFADVKKYLENGDVSGIYASLLANNKDILNKLSELKMMVEAGNFPPVGNLWRLNQQCSKTILFGQYAAEVLFRILEGR